MIKELKELKANGILVKLYKGGVVNQKTMALMEVEALYEKYKHTHKACEIVILISDELDKSIRSVWRYLQEIKQDSK